MRKDTVNHARYHVLSKDELNRLLMHSIGIDRFVIYALTYTGMRESELAHMKASWIHINDEESKKLKIDHIRIPEGRQKCDCNFCTRQAFYEHERGEERKSKVWYIEKQEEYCILKNSGELPALKPYWMPKSSSGSRVIPIFNKELKDELLRWFKTHDSVNLTHDKIYQRVKKVGRKAFGDRMFYPHVLRATAATYLAEKGLKERSLISYMGWSDSNSAKPYIRKNERILVEDMRNVL